jgi:hypothetical protein
MIGRIEKRAGLGNSHLLLRLPYLHDVVAADLAFLQARVVAVRPLDVSSAGIRGSFIRMPTR